VSRPAVEARSLTKSYGRAASRGIVDVDLTIDPGSVVGLVGANGAGKTTLMRTLLDFVRPTSGSITAFGLDSVTDSVAVRRRTAYLPGELVLPRRLTGHQVLDRYAFARASQDPAEVASLADRLGLDLTRRVGDLSKGNKQKVGLLLAFSAKADLLVLDEPTSGLDPLLQRVVAELVKDASNSGRTVLLSSHVMSEVEHVAHTVALMREGRIAAFDQVATIREQARRRGRLTVTGAEGSQVAAALRALPTVSDVEADADMVTFAYAGVVDPVVKTLAAFSVGTLELTEADLEDAFFAGDVPPKQPPATGDVP
jgi:beta-exotoxin I transport system ATP-binding protein